MELLLNVAWLALACAALGRWAHGRLRADCLLDRRTWRLESAALGCALVLLFPIVSLSDDLQAEPAAAEAGRGTQPTVKSAGDQFSFASVKAHPVAIGALADGWCALSNTVLHRIDDRAPSVRLPQHAWCASLRAPPLAHS